MSIKIIKELGVDVMAAKKMINEVVAEAIKEVAPAGKSIDDFGGGHIEILKTKANVVIYFGFTKGGNRVSSKFEIEREEVALWTEALAESVWNDRKKVKSFKKNYSFTAPEGV